MEGDVIGRGAATVKNHWYSMVRLQRKLLYSYVIDEVIRTDNDVSCVSALVFLSRAGHQNESNE